MPKPQTYGLGALIRKERQEKEQQGLTPPEPTPSERGRPPDSMVDAHVNSADTPAHDIIVRPPSNIADAHQSEQRTPTSIQDRRPPVDGVGSHRRDADAHQKENRISVDARKSTKNRRGRPPKNSSGGRTGDRHRSDLVRHAIRLDPGISKLFNDFCEKRNWTFQEFVEFAGVHLMNFADAHQNNLRTPLDDDDNNSLYLTKPFIINLYRRLTKNSHWRPADDRAGARFNSADARVIEYAMLATAVRTRAKKIHSFAYFVPEIEAQLEEVAESGVGNEALEAMLASARRHLLRMQDEN
jgi:hypothetical protein